MHFYFEWTVNGRVRKLEVNIPQKALVPLLGVFLVIAGLIFNGLLGDSAIMCCHIPGALLIAVSLVKWWENRQANSLQETAEKATGRDSTEEGQGLLEYALVLGCAAAVVILVLAIAGIVLAIIGGGAAWLGWDALTKGFAEENLCLIGGGLFLIVVVALPILRLLVKRWL